MNSPFCLPPCGCEDWAVSTLLTIWNARVSLTMGSEIAKEKLCVSRPKLSAVPDENTAAGICLKLKMSLKRRKQWGASVVSVDALTCPHNSHMVTHTGS